MGDLSPSLFIMNEIEEIKNRVDILEIVGGYVDLKKAGRNYKGLCPFHAEKTPSFMVSPEKQIWRCFGACNEGGDAFSFLQKVEGLSFGEAIQKLAEKTGVKLERKSYEKDESKRVLFSANRIATDFYKELLGEKEGEVAKKYLIQKRSLSEKTISDFELGFAPRSKKNLIKELEKHNIKENESQRAGLAKEKNGIFLDFFWNRLMFPIKDSGGQTIAFSARVLDDSLPKYINTPETDIYSKSNSLYGLDLAKESIRKLDYAILVEGMMDVVASHQAGVKNVVAPGGTALTESQLRLIQRFTKNIKLAFDIDFAGSEATRRAIEIAWQMGFNIKVITIPEGKDPGDIAITKTAVWKKAIKDAKYVVDYLFDESLKKFNKKDAIGRRYIAKELLPVIKRIPDAIEKDTYIKRLANELLVDEESIQKALKNISLPKEKREKAEKTKTIKNHQLELEKNTIGLLALLPNYLDFAETILEKEDFTDGKVGIFYEKMVKYYEKNKDFSESKFLASLKKGDGEVFKHYILYAETNFSDLDEEKRAEEIYFGAKRIKKNSLAQKKELLTKKIKEFEESNDHKGAEKALKELNAVHLEERRIS
ncbi:MAG: DNA primase [Patescibacteria group bacterium]|nr:DNA primase [Patescibacteria group bacterium]